MLGEIWSCHDCEIIHRPDVVDEVMRSLMAGETLSEAWKKVLRWI